MTKRREGVYNFSVKSVVHAHTAVLSVLNKCADMPPEWSAVSYFRVSEGCRRILIKAHDRLQPDTYTYATS